MKSVFTGGLAALVVAFIAFFVLNTQQSEIHAISKGTGADIRQEVGKNLVGKDFSVKGH